MTNSRLGKGLSALISEESLLESQSDGFIPNLPAEYIDANRYQPRSTIETEDLMSLADSIREHGVVEPLIVTKQEGGRYELVAGERRLRAAKLAGVTEVPVLIKELTPQQMLELAIIENIQRKDLNALEEANAFEQLKKEFGLSLKDMSVKLGLSESAISNKMRLLALPEEVRNGLLEAHIDEGHARALLGLKDEPTIMMMYHKIRKEKLSVRAVEELVRRLNVGTTTPRKTSPRRIVDAYSKSVESFLQKTFTKKSELYRSKRGGKIVIGFKNDEQLKEVLERIGYEGNK